MSLRSVLRGCVRRLIVFLGALTWGVIAPVAWAACSPVTNQVEKVLYGAIENFALSVVSRFSVDQELNADRGWRARIDTELDLRAWPKHPPRATLCVSVVLETEEGLPRVHQRAVEVSELDQAEGWTYSVELELPETTAQVLVLVEHAMSGSWGVALAEENEVRSRPPGPRAVHLTGAGSPWHELRGGAAAAKGVSSARAAVIRLVPPRDQPRRGATRFDLLVSNTAVERVVYFLDGEQVAERRRSPFSARLELADPPRAQTVRAVAFDAAGLAFGEDTLVVNQLDVPFRVTIDSLRGDPASGAVEVSAQVTVPTDAKLVAVEVYRNDERVARLEKAPFRATVPTPRPGPDDFVRVAALLADGSSIDDVVLLSSPGAAAEVDVNLVELHAVVTNAQGEPIADLKREDFAVIVRGQARPIESFAYADDVPLVLGVVVDTSGSMELVMHDTRKAAAKFLGTTVLSQDRAFVVDFDERPRLLQSTTDDMTALLSSLARLEARGTTALYDAIVFSMLQFEPEEGRKALVVLSDGDDRDSRFGPRRAIEVGHQWGVPIYLIGLGELDTLQRFYPKRELRAITEETGGRLYFVDSLGELDAAYAQIKNELRSQYSLSFYADRDLSDEERRQVTVRVDRSGATVRTVVGKRRASGS